MAVVAKRTPFVEWLDRMMVARNVRNVDIARALDVSATSISEWFSKGSMPSRVNALKLADFLLVPHEEVLILTGHMQPEPEPDVADAWPQFGETLALTGDDAEIARAAVAALLTLPEPMRSMMRAQWRTASGLVLRAAELAKRGARLDWEGIPPPPDTNGE